MCRSLDRPVKAGPGRVRLAATRTQRMREVLRDLPDDERARRVAVYAAIALFFYFAEQLFWPAPLGVLVQGLVIGGLTALIAFGIALIYRANRIINFAQGDLGGVPASLAVLLIVGPGLPYVLALPIGLAARDRPRRARRVRVHPSVLQGAAAHPHRRHDRRCRRSSPCSASCCRARSTSRRRRRASRRRSTGASRSARRLPRQRHHRDARRAGRDRRARRVLPLHERRHRRPGERRERRPRVPARRPGEADPDDRVGRRHGAVDRRRSSCGPASSACRSAACSARRSSCARWPRR